MDVVSKSIHRSNVKITSLNSYFTNMIKEADLKIKQKQFDSLFTLKLFWADLQFIWVLACIHSLVKMTIYRFVHKCACFYWWFQSPFNWAAVKSFWNCAPAKKLWTSLKYPNWLNRNNKQKINIQVHLCVFIHSIVNSSVNIKKSLFGWPSGQLTFVERGKTVKLFICIEIDCNKT